MNYGELEIDIQQRINSKLIADSLDGVFESYLMPENVASFKAAYEKGRVTIEYKSSTFSLPKSTAQISQLETMTFRMSFEGKILRGANGVYRLMEVVKKYLLGYMPVHCSRMFISKYDLLEFEQNQWQPYLEFQCTTIAVQDEQDEESLTGIVPSDFNGDVGNDFNEVPNFKSAEFR